MDTVTGVLICLIALCAFSALCDNMLSSGKLLTGVRLVSGLLVVESAIELLRSMVAMVGI